MKIIAVSDIHIPKNDAYMPDLIQKINSSDADVLLLGGDIAPANDQALENFLQSISGFKGVKMYISGNHDLWIVTEVSSKERLESVLPGIYKKYGAHSLEQQPIIYKGVGFAGNIGWYDYSLVRVYSPPPGTKFIQLDDNYKPTSNVLNWSQLTNADWRRKEIMVKGMLGVKSTTGCNDRDYIKGLGDDLVFCEQMKEKIENDLYAIENEVSKIVVMFHCVPFKEGLIRNNSSPEVCVRNAYTGSKLLGEVLYRHQKVQVALWGHVHKRQEFKKGKIRCANVSLDKTASNPYELEL